MRRMALISMLLVACGPSLSDPDGGNNGNGPDGGAQTQPDAAWAGDVGTVQGTVWAPGNAPGMVPTGHEIPVYGALVWLSAFQPDPIPDTVYCEQCVDPPGKSVFTDHKGTFQLANIVPGTYWLIIQKGQFRIDQQVVISANHTLELPVSMSTLPSVHDPAGGRYIPRIALASGLWDQVEDILGKMQLGEVGSNGQFVGASAAGVFDVYSNGGSIDSVAIGTLTELMTDYARMSQYHIIFVPCSSTSNTGPLQSSDPTVRQNIRDYIAAGGKLYVTDWSGEWEDNVFPAQIQFAADHDTPAAAYNAITETWNPAMFGDADGFPAYESEHARAEDPDLHEWLHGQQGPIVVSSGSYSTGAYNGGDFFIEGNFDHIEALPTVDVGVDDEGFPVTDTAYAYIIGDEDGGPVNKPLTVTFEPAGCGRVLYSTYHTADNTHPGLLPQERVLLYLIMEIGVCKSGPIIE